MTATTSRRPHPAVRHKLIHPAGMLIGLESFLAVSAWAGAVAFAIGAADKLAEQLPGPGRVVGAVALATCIALPTTVVSLALVRRHPLAARAAFASALVLAGWLLGQIVFVGLSVLQPALLIVAGFVAGLSRELIRNESERAGLREDFSDAKSGPSALTRPSRRLLAW
jgi:hypothetical protein